MPSSWRLAIVVSSQVAAAGCTSCWTLEGLSILRTKDGGGVLELKWNPRKVGLSESESWDKMEYVRFWLDGSFRQQATYSDGDLPGPPAGPPATVAPGSLADSTLVVDTRPGSGNIWVSRFDQGMADAVWAVNVSDKCDVCSVEVQ